MFGGSFCEVVSLGLRIFVFFCYVAREGLDVPLKRKGYIGENYSSTWFFVGSEKQFQRLFHINCFNSQPLHRYPSQSKPAS